MSIDTENTEARVGDLVEYFFDWLDSVLTTLNKFDDLESQWLTMEQAIFVQQQEKYLYKKAEDWILLIHDHL